MTSPGPVRRPTGFTLIELMVVVAIISILSSVAIPVFTRAQIRTRVSERATVLDALGRGINDVMMSKQGLPDTDPKVWVGADNPKGDPGTSKRIFSYAEPGWVFLPLIIQGSCYYTYSFLALDQGSGTPASVTLTAVGDLDGDGNPSTKVVHYTSKGYSLLYDHEVPVAGAEDEVTYGTY